MYNVHVQYSTVHICDDFQITIHEIKLVFQATLKEIGLKVSFPLQLCKIYN
jgi:hypothetical protein